METDILNYNLHYTVTRTKTQTQKSQSDHEDGSNVKNAMCSFFFPSGLIFANVLQSKATVLSYRPNVIDFF